MINDPYIINDPLLEDVEEDVSLYYSEAIGQYVKDDLEDSLMTLKDPHHLLNEKNAIILNCQDSSKFQEFYN